MIAAIYTVLFVTVALVAFVAGWRARELERATDQQRSKALHPSTQRATIAPADPAEHVRLVAPPPYDWNAGLAGSTDADEQGR